MAGFGEKSNESTGVLVGCEKSELRKDTSVCGWEREGWDVHPSGKQGRWEADGEEPAHWVQVISLRVFLGLKLLSLFSSDAVSLKLVNCTGPSKLHTVLNPQASPKSLFSPLPTTSGL